MTKSQFPESTAVRDYVRDLLTTKDCPFVAGTDLPRTTGQVLQEGEVREALIRLNPEIAAEPTRADEVLHRLRAIILSARHTPHPVVANEEFAKWLTGGNSMPFGPGGSHTSVRLIDFDDSSMNLWTNSTEVTFAQGRVERRFDLVLWCNGFPLVVGEAKSATRPAYTWIDSAAQINDDYEKNVPMFFVPNVFSFATEGKDFRYGSVGMPVEIWGPWREDETDDHPAPVPGLATVKEAAEGCLNPDVINDFLRFFTAFATDKKHRKIKIIARFQQFQGTNLIVDRVLLGRVKQGLIWHFQGSGKSLLMVFTAQKLRATAGLSSPTVIIVVDRIDLDLQITRTFNASEVPGLVSTNSRAELQTLLKQGARKIIVTTIHKFGEAEGVLDTRDNIIVMADEAHRSQEGDYGRKMRGALPNAFMFGLTGTPVDRTDRNTFLWFGSTEDEGGYLHRYSMADAIRDGAILPLHFEPRLTDVHIDQEAIDVAFEELAEEHRLSEADKVSLSARAASVEAIIKAPGRVQKVAADIADHFLSRVAPQGFKAQVVVYDKASCVAYKEELDKYLGPDASTIVMSKGRNDPAEWSAWTPDADGIEAFTARFNDPADPLKIVIVTAKLLTGFDSAILYAQYLDKPIKKQNLLQAITRTNRLYPPTKNHGLIVDYLGVFDNVAKALRYNRSGTRAGISNIAEVKAQMPVAMEAALAFFPGVDRTLGGWQGLIQAQAAIAEIEKKDAFGLTYSVVSQLWEVLSPDPGLNKFEDDYRWLTDVYQSVRPQDITGRLIWHALGAKTIDLINEHVQVEVPRTDLETIVLNETLLDDFIGGRRKDIDPAEVEKQITARIARHLADPKFVALGKRLIELREKYEDVMQTSLDFIRELLKLATDTVAAEKETEAISPEERAKAALTDLFESLKTDGTPVIVENVVNRIDEVVRPIRDQFAVPGRPSLWRESSDGDREVQRAIRGVLYIQFKIRDNDVYEKALEYVREYY